MNTCEQMFNFQLIKSNRGNDMLLHSMDFYSFVIKKSIESMGMLLSIGSAKITKGVNVAHVLEHVVLS